MELRLVLKNAAALSIASVLSKAIAAIVGIVVTRYLGPGPFGEYSAAYAFVSTFILFTDFGLSQLMVQEGSREEKVLPLYLGNTLVFKLITSLIMFAMMLVLMRPAGYSQVTQTMVIILGIASALNALDASVYNYFQAKQQMYLAAGYQFLSTFLIGLLTIIVVLVGGSVITITVTHLFTAALITVLLYRAVTKNHKLRVNVKEIPIMFRRGLSFGIAYIFYNIYFQIATVILSLMATNTELGIYSAAYRLVSILLFIPGILTSVLYPVLFQLGVTSREKHQDTIEKIFKVLSAVGIPGSVLLFVLGGPIVDWLYGGRFPESAPILMLLSWFFALECLSFALGDVLTTTDRQWSRTIIQGIAALMNIGLNLLLIRFYGIYGAAYATLATELYIFLAYYFIVRKKVYKVRIVRQLPIIVISSVMMGAIAYLLRFIHPIQSAAIAGLVYLGLLVAFDPDFRRIGRYVWRKGLGLVQARS